MIIHDIDAGRPVIGPNKTQSELIVDTNAMVALPVPLERLETVARRHSQSGEGRGSVQTIQFASRDRPQRSRTDPASEPRVHARKHVFDAVGREGPDHRVPVSRTMQ